MPTTPNLSDCHQAPVTIGGTDGSTQFYICSVCKQACNPFGPATPNTLGFKIWHFLLTFWVRRPLTAEDEQFIVTQYNIMRGRE